ncbi:HEPN domain-containing protein [Mucilaginibacter sp.]|uniref:HEPN domain-containing protein n=1 Tax=Mucilaginibacter sp. TaxID=1882438 RepID=UPI003B0006EC
MNLRHYSTWDFYPQYLNRDEVNNPLTVIVEFFSADWLPGHLEALKTWRTFVTEDRHYTDRQNNPANLLYTYMLHVQLVEACFLLMQSSGGRKKDNPREAEQDKQLLQEKSTWLHFPKGLSHEELLDPYLVLESFFKDYNLPQYRDFLYQWLEKGLSRFAADEAMPAREIIRVYENLEKLYQATWLIRRREMEPVLKKKNDNVAEVARETEEAETIAAEITIAEGKEITETEVKKEGTNETLSSVGYRPPTLETSVTQEGQQLLSKIISIVKHKVPTVEAVIYLGAISGKPDEIPSIYLLVIVSNDERKQGHELTSTIEESCKPLANVTALVHSAGIVLKAVERKNYFFCNSFLKPVLYLSGNVLLPVPPEIDGELLKQKREENFQHWYGQANEFLNGADYYWNSSVYGLASFSLHQAAENALTAIIRAVLGYRLNLHNLARLLRITEIFTEELKSVFSLDTIEGVQLFNLLQKAYNEPRYKDDFKPEEASVRLLFDLVSKLLERVNDIYMLAYGE